MTLCQNQILIFFKKLESNLNISWVNFEKYKKILLCFQSFIWIVQLACKTQDCVPIINKQREKNNLKVFWKI
jgi:hypothetical protein